MKIFIIIILLWYIHDACCSVCIFTSGSTSVEAKLKLDRSMLNICDIILENCPKNMTSLSVTSETTNLTYSFHLDCLSRNILPKIKKLSIEYVTVELSTKFNVNFSANLHEIVLKGCRINALPQLGTFYGFGNLEIIDLRDNLLQEVPQDLLHYSPFANRLDLSSNRLFMLPFLNSTLPSLVIDVSNNTLGCSCTNAWVASHFNFHGYSCTEDLSPCPQSVILGAYVEQPVINPSNDSFQVSVLPGASISLGCHIDSSISVDIFWVTPVGVIAVLNTTKTYGYTVQPILAETSLIVSRSSDSTNIMITNTRGHLSGIWYCIGHSPVKVAVSPAIFLHIYSGLYQESVYYTSLYYGFSAMIILLLVGIVGGTIRYCSETHCLRRPQPPFAYGGNTFIGVIPVPEVDEKSKQKCSGNNSLQFLVAERRCNLCNSPPTYWFCDKCEILHYVESIFERLDRPDMLLENVPCGVLSEDGKIKIVGSNMNTVNDNQLTVNVDIPNDSIEVQPLIITGTLSDTNEFFDNNCLSQERKLDAKVFLSDVYVRSNECMVRLGRENECPDVSSMVKNLCCHYSLRRTGADVKLVVSNEKLAEEYRKALDGLANAVANPDPARFREGLEEFRSRLRRDVGHGVKVLRGEFHDLREKSAKGVASLRSQSSVAAQRMRAGFSHSMEQMKDSMRSVAELCGASGTVGQTISVVSIYKDENDNTLKERFVSDFIF